MPWHWLWNLKFPRSLSRWFLIPVRAVSVSSGAIWIRTSSDFNASFSDYSRTSRFPDWTVPESARPRLKPTRRKVRSSAIWSAVAYRLRTTEPVQQDPATALVICPGRIIAKPFRLPFRHTLSPGRRPGLLSCCTFGAQNLEPHVPTCSAFRPPFAKASEGRPGWRHAALRTPETRIEAP